jgi:hypothetical protein
MTAAARSPSNRVVPQDGDAERSADLGRGVEDAGRCAPQAGRDRGAERRRGHRGQADAETSERNAHRQAQLLIATATTGVTGHGTTGPVVAWACAAVIAAAGALGFARAATAR